MSTTQNQLGATLWGVANQLRGTMDPDDFRDYMLSFLFLRYLSENYEDAARKELGMDYPTLPTTTNDDNEEASHTPLAVWYEQNSDDVAEFEKLMRRRVHYIIKPNYLWQNITKLASTENPELLNTLRKGFRHIEEESFESTFQGLFSEINLDSDKLGKSPTDRNAKLSDIIKEIAKGIEQFPSGTDLLGDAYEYLIGQFAAGSGKKAGEFYTPQYVSDILSEIVVLDGHNPKAGPLLKLDKVLDMACGSGSLLLNVRQRLQQQGGSIGKIYGQENNITTYNLARMNMLLHGVKDTEFEIFHGDTLKNEWPELREENPAKKIEFNAVVANPPFSLRWKPTEAMKQDFRFKNYDLAPKSAADFAFVLHGFHFLHEQGTMAVILPHGVLFRSGPEETIRKKLLTDGNIDTVIGVPANLFYSTGIPVCILVLKKCKRSDDVLFINAAEDYNKGKRQNVLNPEHIARIVKTYRERPEKPIDRYARRVGLAEIEQNGYNLNISRYVSTSTEEEEIDLAAVHQQLLDIEDRVTKFRDLHNQYLQELGLSTI